MKTILIKLAGPLQSWGTSSHFETRETDYYPSKSAVIGMIGACLGLRRDDEEIRSLNALNFAVRVDQRGILIQDYHTVFAKERYAVNYEQKGDIFKMRSLPNKDHVYITRRYYLEDAIFIVALGSDDEVLMNKIHEALKRPYFQPYMGRRSTPLPADFLIDVTEENVIDSLKNLSWQVPDFRKRNAPEHIRLALHADADLLDSNAVRRRRDHVVSFSQKHRQFSFRMEKTVMIDVKNDFAQLVHDPFQALGEE